MACLQAQLWPFGGDKRALGVVSGVFQTSLEGGLTPGVASQGALFCEVF